MRARYYDPNAGRFISQDPGNNGNNWYIYVDDNPTNLIDKTGKDALSDAIADWYDAEADKLAQQAIGCATQAEYWSLQAMRAEEQAEACASLDASLMTPTGLINEEELRREAAICAAESEYQMNQAIQFDVQAENFRIEAALLRIYDD